ncbi:hypothetical protein DV736_g3191, partial [Chaetothyriales sp. CBS 134916]
MPNERLPNNSTLLTIPVTAPLFDVVVAAACEATDDAELTAPPAPNIVLDADVGLGLELAAVEELPEDSLEAKVIAGDVVCDALATALLAPALLAAEPLVVLAAGPPGRLSVRETVARRTVYAMLPYVVSGKSMAPKFEQVAVVSINYLRSHNRDEESLLNTLRTEAFDAIKARSALPPPKLEDIPLLCIPGDISLPETGPNFVKQTVAKFGRLDTFVSNAGICQFEAFLEISPESLQKHLNTNLSGSFYAIQAAAKQMSQQQPQGGSIIGISSISALVGGAQQCHYTPTKAGILSLMQSTATALGKYNIRCNALLPGTIRTQLNDKDLKDGSEKKVYMERRIPLADM